MSRFFTLIGTTVVAGLVGWSSPAGAQPGTPRGGEERVRRIASASSGFIEGVVMDERGHPLSGAMVSALGAVSALAVTDRDGAFVLRALPAGAYLLRAHLAGFTQSKRQFVQVGPGGTSRFSVTLQRILGPNDPPTVLAAGLGGNSGSPPAINGTSGAGDSGAADDHSEQAWRLRHLKRSILKEAERAALDITDDQPRDDGTFSFIARALGSSAQFIADLPLTAQVNFLTSGSFDGAQPADGFGGAARGVAFVSIGGPAFRHGDWSAQVMTQGQPGSWYLAGTYRKRSPAHHLFDVGVSYSTQRFTAASRWPVSADMDGERTAGSIYALDRWTVSPYLSLTYGGRYARYGYLSGGLFSPHMGVTLLPMNRLRIKGLLSQRWLAPGAEEFLEPLAAGLWVPPERTFIGLTPVTPERTRHYELALEHDLWRDVVLAVRAFIQHTQDQQVALFGAGLQPVPTGHYEIGNHGDVEATGWSVGLSSNPFPGVRGSIAYGVVDGHWRRERTDAGLVLVGAGARPVHERLHDLTTTVETRIAPTATSVIVAYKLNSAFARRDGNAIQPGLDARFDVQVMQGLPFLDFTSARWELLVAVRNMFRDQAGDGSVYDELLVLRPPKRVVGGLLVRF